MRTARGLAAAVVVLLACTGCTGIPRQSQPQVVSSAAVPEPSTEPELLAPKPGESERDIVHGFLDANLSGDADLTVAKDYLVPEARQGWNPTQIKVVDGLRPPVLNSDGIVTVTVDQRLGDIDDSGQYMPQTGPSKSADRTFSFQMQRSEGQWRIADPPPFLIIDSNALIPSYRRTLYFFDSTNSYLVPDPRYTTAAEQSLSTWVLDQLIAGPRVGLRSALHSELPTALDPKDASVTLSPTRQLTINIPGSTRLDPSQRTRLGAELAFTYDSAQQSGGIRITDGPKTVTLPGGLQTFTTHNFAAYAPNSDLHPTGYYLAGGMLYADRAAKPVPGPFGGGRYRLTSVAVRQSTDTQVDIAGVQQGRRRLLFGGTRGAVTEVSLPAPPTTRPEWNPVQRQLWIGVGSQVYVATESGASPVVLADATAALPRGYRIGAVRLSPDGARVALVVSAAGTSSVWVGAVAVSGKVTQVTNLAPITPSDQVVSDLGWTDSSTLAYIGTAPARSIAVWTIVVDGSDNRVLSTLGLPSAPTSVAASGGSELVVSVGEPKSASLWQESGDTWTAAFGSDSQKGGYAPTFAA